MAPIAFIRWARTFVPVPLNGQVVWTRYFTPRQFHRAFAADFELTSHRGLFRYYIGSMTVWEDCPLSAMLAIIF